MHTFQDQIIKSNAYSEQLARNCSTIFGIFGWVRYFFLKCVSHWFCNEIKKRFFQSKRKKEIFHLKNIYFGKSTVDSKLNQDFSNFAKLTMSLRVEVNHADFLAQIKCWYSN